MKPGRGEKLSVAEVEQLSSEHGKQVEASAAGSQLGGDFQGIQNEYNKRTLHTRTAALSLMHHKLPP